MACVNEALLAAQVHQVLSLAIALVNLVAKELENLSLQLVEVR